MKKERQTSRQGPIQLSANKKSHSINIKTKQQPLFAPYKIDWKNPTHDNVLFSANQSVPLKQPFKNIENNNVSTHFGNGGSSNTNSKLFYKNMKNELLNIKQDVEKLILKQKKTSIASIDQMITATEDHPLSEHQNNNGCIKTVSIKNKCQQKPSKVDSVYENVDKFIASKISQNGLGSSKLNVGDSKYDHPVMNNFIEDQAKNSSNAEIKYRSEKDSNYMRTKSKSIAECFTKNFALDLINFKEEKKDSKASVASSQKFLSCEENPNQEQPMTQRTERAETTKQKMEVEIKLPSFDKPKTDQVQEEKNKLIQKLQKELNDLEKELSLRDELMSRKQQCKFQLTEEVQKIKKQLQSEMQANEERQKQNQEEICNLRNINQQNQNRAKFYEEELQKAIQVIRQKEQQTFTMMENLNSQTNTIQQLSTACQKLRAHNKEMKQSVEESRNIKEKMKLKENQLYIYQEELKEAKSKIKELKESLSGQALRTSENPFKSIEQQQKALEQSSKLSWQLKESLKLNQNLKSQNERLKKELHSINSINSENQSKIAQVIKENSELKLKILEFEKDSQKVIQDLVNKISSQGLGNQISKKLSLLSEENYQLKNKINRLQANVEELTLKNYSLTEELKIHQEKASLFKDCTRRLKVEDWDNLTEERDQLKSQLQVVKSRLDETKQFYELQTMRKQNQIHELKQQINQMIDFEVQKEQSFHPNVRSVKHIKNLETLLNEFKDMIEYNLELKQELEEKSI